MTPSVPKNRPFHQVRPSFSICVLFLTLANLSLFYFFKNFFWLKLAFIYFLPTLFSIGVLFWQTWQKKCQLFLKTSLLSFSLARILAYFAIFFSSIFQYFPLFSHYLPGLPDLPGFKKVFFFAKKFSKHHLIGRTGKNHPFGVALWSDVFVVSVGVWVLVVDVDHLAPGHGDEG